MASSNFIGYPEAQADDATYEFTPQELEVAQQHVAKYPDKQSAIMPLLWMAQEKYGWLPQGAMQLVAHTLGVPYAQVYGVATFYTMYLKENRAPHLFEICTCFSCGECDGQRLYDWAKTYLDVNDQGVSADGKIWLREAECLGACDTAPVCQVDNRRLRYNLTEDKIKSIVDELREDRELPYESVPLYDQTNLG